MAVWGRAMMAAALLAALTACEYTAEGDPRPGAVAESVPVSPSAAPESTPDPEQEKRIARMYGEVNALLGKPTQSSLGIVGTIGEPTAVVEAGKSELPAALTGSGTAEPGQYTVKVVCVGSTEIRFAVHDGNESAVAEKVGQADSPWFPCGEVTSVRRTLKSGQVMVEIQGKAKGVEAVGGIQIVKAPAKAAPKP